MINKDGNLYTFSFAILLVCIVGTTLAVASQGLKTKQLKNASDKKMISILSAVNIDANRINARSLFDKYILENESKVISGLNIKENSFNIDIKKEYRNTKISLSDRNYPLFVCKKDTSTYYIIPVVGTGLWGPIWGYISLESDFKTIYGANFDHKTETPGLGAEIKESFYSDQYIGEKITDEFGKFKPITVVKDGSGYGINSKVDGITGGTITSKGVEEMTSRTLEVYVNYFKNINN